jgi:methyl-accepting chemotaxis protein
MRGRVLVFHRQRSTALKPVISKLASLSIKGKMALAFTLILAISALTGVTSMIGFSLMSSKLHTIIGTDLPQSSNASRLSEEGAKLETLAVAYLLQESGNADDEAGIRSGVAAIGEILADSGVSGLQPEFAAVAENLEGAIAAHRKFSEIVFLFEGRTYVLPDFINRIAVENARYIKLLQEAARFGMFDGINPDPQATTFSRWRRDFTTGDVALEELLATYARAEGKMIGDVARKIITKTTTAETQTKRMIARRLPAMDRAIDALAADSTTRSAALWSAKVDALAKFRSAMDGFITHARRLNSQAVTGMKDRIVQAGNLGRSAMIVVLLVFCLGMGFAIAGSVMVTRYIGVPLGDLTRVIAALAERNFDGSVPHKGRRDEIGRIAVATEIFRKNTLERDQLEEQQSRVRQIEARRLEMEALETRNEHEKHRQEDAEKRAVALRLEEFQSELRMAVETARAGDFSIQLRTDLQDRDLSEFAKQMNALLLAVAGGVGETSKVLNEIAIGNLGCRMEGEYSGIFADLQRDTNATGDKLAELVSAIKTGTSGINTATEHIVGGANSLSERTINHVTALDETSHAVSGIARSVTDNSRNAEQAKTLSRKTTGIARQGHDIAARAVAAIRLVQESTEQISTINNLVDNLAYQMNLLSLNASVEAARAGDAGKGFAVVAQEVRGLARQSKAAADKIKALVQETSKRVNTGVDMVEATGASLADIQTRFADLDHAIGDISETCSNQTVQADNIADIVSRLDHETRENAKLASLSQQTAKDLSDRADDLWSLISYFDVSAKQGEMPVAPPGTGAAA